MRAQEFLDGAGLRSTLGLCRRMTARWNRADGSEAAGGAQRHIIKRPRLTKLFDEAEGRILLLIAPAGYGKTTLAREWLSQRGRRGLWYRARTGASDVAVAARSCPRRLRLFSSTIERSTRELLAALTTPEDEPDAIADLLADELDSWPVGTWLVIDEYELVAPHAGPVRLVERFVQVSGARVLITGPRSSELDQAARPAVRRRVRAARGDALDDARRGIRRCSRARRMRPPAWLRSRTAGRPLSASPRLLPGEVNPTTDVQSALFDYVAQELFDKLDADVQRHLVLLSMPSTLTPALVQSAVGDDAERVLSLVDQRRPHHGAGRDKTWRSIHFAAPSLQQKVWDIGVGEEQIDALAVWMLDASEWDDAFELISRFGLRDRLPLLIERGLRTCLSRGSPGSGREVGRVGDEERLEGRGTRARSRRDLPPPR